MNFTLTPNWIIWSAASANKAWANMASNTSKAKAEPKVIQMAELGARLAKRKAELGLPEMPRNAGKNRTPSKRALLKAIKDLGGEW